MIDFTAFSDELVKIAKVRLVRFRRRIPNVAPAQRVVPGGKWRSLKKIERDEGTFFHPRVLQQGAKRNREEFWRTRPTERTHPSWPLQSTKRELGGEY